MNIVGDKRPLSNFSTIGISGKTHFVALPKADDRKY